MLADFLNSSREQLIRELEQRADTTEGPGLPAIERTGRLNALFDELIAALRHAEVDTSASTIPAAMDSAIDRGEGELVRRYVIEKIEERLADASPMEAAIVSEWASKTELRRVREENRQLRTLLDKVDESTVILTSDGRFTYLNRTAT